MRRGIAVIILALAACGGAPTPVPTSAACSCPGAIEQVSQPSGAALCRCVRCFCANADLQMALTSLSDCGAKDTLYQASCF